MALTALITGGSRGIGRDICYRLARRGMLVAVHYGTNSTAADEVVAAIHAEGGQAFAAIGADLSSFANVPPLLAQLDRELATRNGSKRLDVLVNNAGISPHATLEEITPESFDDVITVNLKAPLFLIQHAASRMENGGRIVNVSSITAIRARPTHVVYGASKAALNTMTRTLAAALGPRGIIVNAVAPGAVDTEINAEYVRRDPG